MNLEESRELLLEHSRSKKNGQFPVNVTREGKLINPICGDAVHLKMEVQSKQILAIGFSAQACAICTASVSLLCGHVEKTSLQAALDLTLRFENALIDGPEQPWPKDLECLECFQHLRVNPSRKACALLPFTLLRSLVKKDLP